MTDTGSRYTQGEIPEITVGTRITNFGSYDITVSGLASGGMGLVVWGPNRAQGGQMAAVKLPRPDRLAEADLPRRAAILADFEREALTWCHLWPHPCIISAEGLLRMRALGNLPAIFIEYAPEGSLRDLLQTVHRPGSTQTLGLDGVFAWGKMIASALVAMHRPDPDLDRPEPLAHCDLKPENVLFNAQNWAMLTDLGLTRALASLADATPLPSAAAMANGAVGDVADASKPGAGGAASSLTPEQQAQVEQLRRLLAEAGITGVAAPASPSSALTEGVLYGTRTICVPPSQQATLARVVSDQPTTSSLSPSATAVIAQMGSRGQVAGTPPYMAPEQWLGLDAVEPASDVYALGVMLFELFAGVGGRASYPHIPDPLLTMMGPFAAWCAAHASGPSRRLSDPDVCALSDGPLVKLVQDGQQARAEKVLTGLDALIRDCLGFAPASRPTAKQVQERLEALAALAELDPLTIPEYPRTSEREATFWENLGITYTEMGQTEKRLPLQRRAVALTPDDPITRTNLGNALGETAQAEQQVAEEAAETGDRATAQRFEAQARAHLEEAVHAFEKAETLLTTEWLTRHPHLANTIPYNLGAALSHLGRYAEAVAARRRALAANPNDAMSYRNLALTYLRWADEKRISAATRIERLEQAEAQMRHALAIAPHYGGGQELLATIQRELAAARRDLTSQR